VTDWVVTFNLGDLTEGEREALCTLGNGYLATRGAVPEHRADGTHYPGTYVAGCYNRLRDSIDDHVVDNESLVNLPNWLPVRLEFPGGILLGGPDLEVVRDQHELGLRRAILTRTLRVRDEVGRSTVITQRRLVHLMRPHVCALQTTIEAENWSGEVHVGASVDYEVRNDGVARYARLSAAHLSAPDRGLAAASEITVGTVETSQSRIRIAVAARVRADAPERSGRAAATGNAAGHESTLAVTPRRPVVVEKVVTVYTSRDLAISDPAEAATEELVALPDFATLQLEHVQAWSRLWQRFHLALVGGPEGALTITRLHQFHVLQTLTSHSADSDVGVPARGLHGEAYRGHILWDELFVLPVLNLHAPVVSRGLLMYRYRRLPAARLEAGRAGHVGAMYPWQSGSSGREESQRLHLNPLSGRWVDDVTYRQRHVGLAVAYNVWQYCQTTGDRRFLEDYGAEMILEVTRFFADLTEYDPARRRYVIRGVMGPDEFHTGYPGTAPTGVDNNAYTNVMVAWLMQRAADTLHAVSDVRGDELRQALHITPDDEGRWHHIGRRLFVPFHADGVISQFEGYERLEEFPWDRYRGGHHDLRRLDRVLEQEGDDPNRYKLSKQADVLMLLYLFSADELREILSRLGYALAGDAIRETVDYYLARTSHGSTLSAVVHAWVLARRRRAEALDYLHLSLLSDIADVQGGTTAEGIHLAAMAGSVDLLQRCFAGVETRSDTLILDPCWPPGLGQLELDIHYRHHRLRLRMSNTSVEVTSAPGDHSPIRLRSRSQTVMLHPGQNVRLGDLLVSRP
jgi:trehalose 6-phosphate phosphatase